MQAARSSQHCLRGGGGGRGKARRSTGTDMHCERVKKSDKREMKSAEQSSGRERSENVHRVLQLVV